MRRSKMISFFLHSRSKNYIKSVDSSPDTWTFKKIFAHLVQFRLLDFNDAGQLLFIKLYCKIMPAFGSGKRQ
jgi:hypothetical protein